MLTKHFNGRPGWETKAKQWIELNQRLLGEHVVLRVFGETGGWTTHPMFGSEPKDEGIWNLKELRQLAKDGVRIRRLTPLNRKVIEWLVRESHNTGVAFEYVVDATLKHTEGLVTATTDHAIRQTAVYFRELIDGPDAPYHNAAILFEARNEWNAHNKMRTKLSDVNMWAQRMYRWAKGDDRKIRFKSPGKDWIAEQWPEGHMIVDGTVDNGVNVGLSAGLFKMSLEHPDRDRPKWWELPPTYEQLKADARGAPFGYNESILYGDQEDKERLRAWYGARGWTVDLPHYMDWYNTCKNKVRYFIIHDEKGMQCDTHWPRAVTRLEAELGDYIPPPPPPPPEPNYRPLFYSMYRDYLKRERNPDGSYGDAGGLEHKNRRFNELLNAGFSFSDALGDAVRVFTESDEYKLKNKWQSRA
jgi:hypothetical protein